MAELLVLGLAKVGITGTLATVLAQVGASVLLSAVARRIARNRANSVDVSRELSVPNSLPPKRFVYGQGVQAIGSPAPAWVVQSGVLYCCHILNSRPSAAVSAVIFDKRVTAFTGDILNFAGAGAVPASGDLAGHAHFWLGLGAQSGPPAQIMSEIGDATGTDLGRFWPTDRWTGQTVLWGRYLRGAAATQAQRWPSAPPEVGAIGDWSRVWDPRDPAQDPDDPTTWLVSSNAWLAILDCLRFNPLARWPLDQINLDSFIAAANDASATRARLGGGTEPRWRLGGTISFGGAPVLLDVIMPMVAATGGDLMIDGGGITAIPAQARSPVLTVTDWLADAPMTFRARQKAADRPRAVQASWPQPEAKFELQTLTPTVVPGQVWTGGEDRVQQLPLDLVPYAAQAQHLQLIEARRLALGRELSFTAGPEVFAHGVQAGDWVSVDLGADYASRNGLYEVAEIQPGEWLADADVGGGGVALRQPLQLREVAADVFGWNPATDEQAVYTPEVAEYSLTQAPPTGLVLTPLPERVSFTFTPAPDATGHEWEWRSIDDGVPGPWNFGAVLPGTAAYTVVLTFASSSLQYEVRIRATRSGAVSDWVVGGPVTPLPPELGP